jgi:gluconate 5-dehydrogenase
LSATTSVFDVTDPAAVETAVAAIEARGPIDILINKAGKQHRGAAAEFPDDAWHDIVRTNLDSVFFVARSVGRRMIARGRGKIVNIGSVQSELCRPTIVPYTATKGALKNLTRGMCVDWARHNIQVNGLGPGYFDTELTRPLVENAEFTAWLKNRTPAQRWGNVKELEGAVVFLASDASALMTGSAMLVDGGWTAE